MGMLDSLNLSSASTGPATGEELLSRAKLDPQASHVDRSVSRDENAPAVDDSGSFESYLNGLVAACAISPYADSASVQVSQQRLVTDEPVVIDLQPALASRCEVNAIPACAAAHHGTRASISAPAGSTEQKPASAALPQTGVPAGPFSPTMISDNVTAGAPIDLSSSEQPAATMSDQIGHRTQSATLAEELRNSAPMSEPPGLAVPNANAQSPLAEPDDSTIAVRSELSAISARVTGRASESAQFDVSAVPHGSPRDAIARADTGHDIQPPTLAGFTAARDLSGLANQPSTATSVAEFAETDLAAATGWTLEAKGVAGNRRSVGLSTQMTDDTLGLPQSAENGKIGPTEAGVSGAVQHSSAANDAALKDADGSLITVETSGDTGTRRSQIMAATIAQVDAKYHRGAAAGDLARGPQQGFDHDGRGTFADSLIASRGPIDATADRAPDRSIPLDSLQSPTAAEQIYGEIATRVELSQRDGRADFRMRLDPPGLGTVHVHLTASGHSVSARLVVNDEAARQAIESQLHTLRETLAGVGVSLERFDVARDGGGSRGAWQWQQPEPVPATAGFKSQGSARRPSELKSRPTMGAIDVVV